MSEDLGSLKDCYVTQANGKRALAVTGGGVPLDVNQTSVKTAFNELAVAQFNPQCGWSFSYNLNPINIEIQELNGGSVVQEGSFAKASTGVAADGVAFVRTQRALVYTPGLGALARFTCIFDTPVENSQQLIGVINAFDGWAFGYNGTQFGILRRRGGIDTWYYQPDWNIDNRPDLDPKKGNVYRISYQWLGFGMQYFGIEAPDGTIKDVHQIEYSNLFDDVSVFNPSLPIAMGVANQGNTTNVSIKSPSAIAGSFGPYKTSAISSLVGYKFSGSIIAAQDQYLFSIRNPDTYQGKDNRLFAEALLLTIATEGVKPVVFDVVFGPDLTAPVWTPIEADVTPLEYDESATAVANGIQIATFTLARADSIVVDLANIFKEEIHAKQYFSILASSANTSDVSIGLTFRSKI